MAATGEREHIVGDVVVRRDVPAKMRDGTHLCAQTSTGRRQPGEFPVLAAAHAVRQDRGAADHLPASRLVCASRVRGRRAGPARPLHLGRRVSPVSRRGHRHGRHDHLGRGPARRERQGRDLRLLLPGGQSAPRRRRAAVGSTRVHGAWLHRQRLLRELDLRRRRIQPRLHRLVGRSRYSHCRMR